VPPKICRAVLTLPRSRHLDHQRGGVHPGVPRARMHPPLHHQRRPVRPAPHQMRRRWVAPRLRRVLPRHPVSPHPGGGWHPHMRRVPHVPPTVVHCWVPPDVQGGGHVGPRMEGGQGQLRGPRLDRGLVGADAQPGGAVPAGAGPLC
jgi:hypothetical protein